MELTSNEFELESLTGFLTQTLFHLLNNLTLLLQNYFLKKQIDRVKFSVYIKLQ